jgi:para-nitrobenzyl esterase
MSEDCLTLNVCKPRSRVRKLPVLVYIHGGGFGGGAGSLQIYDGARLAARGAVAITINHRVGVIAFLAHPALTAESPMGSSGNYGLLDQIAALRWVKANAAQFGGVAANVTVAGESAGAASVADLLISPLARGLFAKAIAFSGASMAVDVLSLATNEGIGLALAETLGATSLAGMRALPPERLIDATRDVPGSGPPRLLFVPNVDGKLLPFDPVDASGPVQSPVPLITGYNSADMIDPQVRTPALFKAAVAARYGAFAERLLALYVFGNIGLGERSFTAADAGVVRQWQARLLAFMRTGRPGRDWQPIDGTTTTVMGLGDSEALRPAISSRERFEAFKAYAQSGGKLGLM